MTPGRPAFSSPASRTRLATASSRSRSSCRQCSSVSASVASSVTPDSARLSAREIADAVGTKSAAALVAAPATPVVAPVARSTAPRFAPVARTGVLWGVDSDMDAPGKPNDGGHAEPAGSGTSRAAPRRAPDRAQHVVRPPYSRRPPLPAVARFVGIVPLDRGRFSRSEGTGCPAVRGRLHATRSGQGASYVPQRGATAASSQTNREAHDDRDHNNRPKGDRDDRHRVFPAHRLSALSPGPCGRRWAPQYRGRCVAPMRGSSRQKVESTPSGHRPAPPRDQVSAPAIARPCPP